MEKKLSVLETIFGFICLFWVGCWLAVLLAAVFIYVIGAVLLVTWPIWIPILLIILLLTS